MRFHVKIRPRKTYVSDETWSTERELWGCVCGYSPKQNAAGDAVDMRSVRFMPMLPLL